MFSVVESWWFHPGVSKENKWWWEAKKQLVGEDKVTFDKVTFFCSLFLSCRAFFWTPKIKYSATYTSYLALNKPGSMVFM